MSDDIDLSWSTPRLLEEDYGDKDFSINVGSCIKRNSISGTYYKIYKKVIPLEVYFKEWFNWNLSSKIKIEQQGN